VVRKGHSTFGHYAEIRKLAQRLSRLAGQLESESDVRVLTLWRSDFDLISRHPDTAAIFQIIVPPSGLPRWRQFQLVPVGHGLSHASVPRPWEAQE